MTSREAGDLRLPLLVFNFHANFIMTFPRERTLGFSLLLCLWDAVWSHVCGRINQPWPPRALTVHRAVGILFIPARNLSSASLNPLGLPAHPSWWNAPTVSPGEGGQMGHLLDIPLLSKNNQGKTWKKTGSGPFLIIELGRLGFRWRVQAKSLGNEAVFLKREVCAWVLGRVPEFSLGFRIVSHQGDTVRAPK